MISIELLLKTLGALGVITGILTTILKGWRTHDRKLVSHDERLDGQDRKMKSMEDAYNEKFARLEGKFDSFIADDKESKRRLHQDINDQGKILARLDGYMMAKKEKE